MKLTNREKKMLILLIVVSVYALCFKFIIAPSVLSINSAKLQLESLEVMKKEMNKTVEVFCNIDEKIEEEFNIDKSDYFYKNIDHIFVDNLMQDLIESHNLKIQSLSFNESENLDDSSPLGNITSIILDIINQKLKLEKNYTNGASVLVSKNFGQNQEQINTSTIVPVIHCTVNIQGQVDNVMNMVNQINEDNKSILITGVNGSVVGGIYTGQISVAIYYIL